MRRFLKIMAAAIMCLLMVGNLNDCSSTGTWASPLWA